MVVLRGLCVDCVDILIQISLLFLSNSKPLQTFLKIVTFVETKFSFTIVEAEIIKSKTRKNAEAEVRFHFIFCVYVLKSI